MRNNFKIKHYFSRSYRYVLFKAKLNDTAYLVRRHRYRNRHTEKVRFRFWQGNIDKGDPCLLTNRCEELPKRRCVEYLPLLGKDTGRYGEHSEATNLLFFCSNEFEEANGLRG